MMQEFFPILKVYYFKKRRKKGCKNFYLKNLERNVAIFKKRKYDSMLLTEIR